MMLESIALGILLQVYSPLPCSSPPLCFVQAEHGVHVDCPLGATHVSIWVWDRGWGKIDVKPCNPGETVRFDVAKYLTVSVPPMFESRWRASASNAAGESMLSLEMIRIVYERGVTVF